MEQKRKRIKLKDLYDGKPFTSVYDFVFLTYLGFYANRMGYDLDYTGMTCTFNRKHFEKSYFVPFILWAKEKGYLGKLPKKIDFLDKLSLERIYGITTDQYQFEKNIFKECFNFDPDQPLEDSYKGLYHFDIYTNEDLKEAGIPLNYFDLADVVENKVYTFTHNAKDFFNQNIETAMISCVAYDLIQALHHKQFMYRCFYVVPDVVTRRRFSLSSIYYLYQYLPILQDFVNISISPNILDETILAYSSWASIGKDLGIFKNYMDKEKKEYLDKTYRVGDVVMVYERELFFNSANFDTLVAAKLGVIKEIRDREIVLTLTNATMTKESLEVSFSRYDEEVLALYEGDDLYGVKVWEETYSFNKVGIDYVCRDDKYYEEVLITKLPPNSPCKEWMNIGGTIMQVDTDFIEVTERLLKDYGIDFNKDRYRYLYKTKLKD